MEIRSEYCSYDNVPVIECVAGSEQSFVDTIEPMDGMALIQELIVYVPMLHSLDRSRL